MHCLNRGCLLFTIIGLMFTISACDKSSKSESPTENSNKLEKKEESPQIKEVKPISDFIKLALPDEDKNFEIIGKPIKSKYGNIIIAQNYKDQIVKFYLIKGDSLDEMRLQEYAKLPIEVNSFVKLDSERLALFGGGYVTFIELGYSGVKMRSRNDIDVSYFPDYAVYDRTIRVTTESTGYSKRLSDYFFNFYGEKLISDGLGIKRSKGGKYESVFGASWRDNKIYVNNVVNGSSNKCIYKTAGEARTVVHNNLDWSTPVTSQTCIDGGLKEDKCTYFIEFIDSYCTAKEFASTETTNLELNELELQSPYGDDELNFKKISSATSVAFGKRLNGNKNSIVIIFNFDENTYKVSYKIFDIPRINKLGEQSERNEEIKSIETIDEYLFLIHQENRTLIMDTDGNILKLLKGVYTNPIVMNDKIMFIHGKVKIFNKSDLSEQLEVSLPHSFAVERKFDYTQPKKLTPLKYTNNIAIFTEGNSTSGASLSFVAIDGKYKTYKTGLSMADAMVVDGKKVILIDNKNVLVLQPKLDELIAN